MDDCVGLSERRATSIDGAGCPAQCIDGLAHVGEVGAKEVAERLGWRCDIHVHDPVAMLEQVSNYGPAGLAASTGNDDAFSRHGGFPSHRQITTADLGTGSKPGDIVAIHDAALIDHHRMRRNAEAEMASILLLTAGEAVGGTMA